MLQADPKWQKRPVLDGSESEYMFKDREWITYETLENIRKRAAYVVANHLGGMFVWSRMFFSLSSIILSALSFLP